LVKQTHAHRIGSVLSHNFGFGGSCAALMFQRPTESPA
jgi:3-oxoacyl-[acyl-carrier-protein] synthase-1